MKSPIMVQFGAVLVPDSMKTKQKAETGKQKF